MNEAKHTPGPWEHWAQGGNFSVTGPAAAAAMVATRAMRESGYGHFVECASSFRESPAIALGDTKERAEANARLIAAAPELLAILSAIIDLNPQLPMGYREEAEAAIAKATGGAA